MNATVWAIHQAGLDPQAELTRHDRLAAEYLRRADEIKSRGPTRNEEYRRCAEWHAAEAIREGLAS